MIRYDAAVVGAGILGLAHAYHLARKGMKVVVFERSARALGASIRNFGMIWPIGLPSGDLHQTALRSREIWSNVLAQAGIWYEPIGSLHLAYHDDEASVLEEFLTLSHEAGFAVRLLSPEQVVLLSPAVRPSGLLTGMYSQTEMCIDPREALVKLSAFLQHTYDVEFHFNTTITGYDSPILRSGNRTWNADRLFVCAGDDFQTLYPEVFIGSGITRCKLQMMRSAPIANGWRIGPMLAGGLTLRHYASFQSCPSLPRLKERIAKEVPIFDKYGIHVMASQNGVGEILIGDSHEYGDMVDPFICEEINIAITNYLSTFMQVPGLQINTRWYGVYAKHPTLPYFTASPAPNVQILVVTTGVGMTLSFGLVEKLLHSYGI